MEAIQSRCGLRFGRWVMDSNLQTVQQPHSQQEQQVSSISHSLTRFKRQFIWAFSWLKIHLSWLDLDRFPYQGSKFLVSWVGGSREIRSTFKEQKLVTFLCELFVSVFWDSDKIKFVTTIIIGNLCKYHFLRETLIVSSLSKTWLFKQLKRLRPMMRQILSINEKFPV